MKREGRAGDAALGPEATQAPTFAQAHCGPHWHCGPQAQACCPVDCACGLRQPQVQSAPEQALQLHWD
jgi:hypothetical protein